VGGRGGHADLELPRSGDSIRQHAGNPERVHVQAATDRPEFLYRLAGSGRSRGGDTRDAV